MNALWQNPLAQMYGPDFLILFAAVAVAVILVARWRICRADSRVEVQNPSSPGNLGAYEVAYLRGGVEEASRLAMLSLFQQGYLEVARKRNAGGEHLDLVETNKHASASLLAGAERIAFDALADSGAGFRDGASSLTEALEAHFKSVKARLTKHGLLVSPQVRVTAILARLVGCALLLGLAGYKVAAALLSGRHNVAVLMILLVIALGVLWAVTKPAWLSARGKRYLESLSDQFGSDASHLKLGWPADAPTLLLLVGIFGAGVLEHTGYSIVSQAFKDQETAAGTCGGGGGCGGGCGGGGCGGGCGGCGG